jgi:hypothetical protein
MTGSINRLKVVSSGHRSPCRPRNSTSGTELPDNNTILYDCIDSFVRIAKRAGFQLSDDPIASKLRACI